MDPSKWLQTATFTTKVTHSIRLAPFSLGAVNSGIGDESNDEQIKYFSVIGLCKYVEVLLQHDVEFVGSNLSTIIVSLFPILYGDNDDDEFESEPELEPEFKTIFTYCLSLVSYIQ